MFIIIQYSLMVVLGIMVAVHLPEQQIVSGYNCVLAMTDVRHCCLNRRGGVFYVCVSLPPVNPTVLRIRAVLFIYFQCCEWKCTLKLLFVSSKYYENTFVLHV